MEEKAGRSEHITADAARFSVGLAQIAVAAFAIQNRGFAVRAFVFITERERTFLLVLM